MRRFVGMRRCSRALSGIGSASSLPAARPFSSTSGMAAAKLLALRIGRARRVDLAQADEELEGVPRGGGVDVDGVVRMVSVLQAHLERGQRGVGDVRTHHARVVDGVFPQPHRVDYAVDGDGPEKLSKICW